MSFNVTVLKEAFYSLFMSMKDGNNDTFAEGVANAVTAFVATGQVTTVDGGAITEGAFSGGGTGSLTVIPSDCSSVIISACKNMKGDPYGNYYFAQEMGHALKNMADRGTVTVTVTGTVTTPGGVTHATGGEATGTISCDSSSLVQGLYETFTQMWNRREEDRYNGNLRFAEKLAQEINDFFTSGAVSTNGTGAIAGSSGTGTIA